MRISLRTALRLVLTAALVCAVVGRGFHAGKMELSTTHGLLVMIAAGGAAAFLRSQGRPFLGVLLAGLVGGLIGLSASPVGVIVGLEAGAIVISAPGFLAIHGPSVRPAEEIPRGEDLFPSRRV